MRTLLKPAALPHSLVAQLALAAAASIAVLVLAGWLLGEAWLVRGGTDGVPMQFNTALSLLCAALAVGFAVRRWQLALLLVLPVLLLALPGAVQELLGVELGVDQVLFRHPLTGEGVPPGRMALNSALALLLAVVAVLVLVRYPLTERARLVVYACGFVVLAIGGLSLAGFALELPRARSWGAVTPMALMTALGVSALGLALLATGWRSWSTVSVRGVLMVNAVALAVVLSTVLIWAQLSQKQASVLVERTEANLVEVGTQVAERVRERALTLRRLADHFERHADELDQDYFLEQAGLIQRDAAGLDLVAWVDRDLRLRWINGLDASRAQPRAGDLVAIDEARVEGFALAEAGEAIVLTRPLELRFRGPGGLVIVPVAPRDRELIGYVATGVPWGDLLAPLLDAHVPGYHLRVLDHGTVLYARGELDALAPSLVRRRDFAVLNRTWSFELAPDPQLAAALRDRLPEAVLASGLLNGGLVTLALGLAGIAGARRREAEQARGRMAINERRFRQLFDLSPLPMWLFDRDSMAFVEVNQAAVDQYGWSREEFAAMTVFDIRPAEERERLRAYNAGTASAERDRAGVWRHRRRDGSEILVDIVVHDFDEGGLHGRLVLARDVTEAEAARRVLETQAQIIDQIAGAIAETDMHGVVRRWNPGAERLLGYSAREMLGQSVVALYPGRDRERLRRELVEPLRAKGHHEAEVVYRHRDGQLVHAHLSLSLLRDASGTPHGMLAFSFDLSERRRAEDELQLLRRALEASSNGVVIADALAEDMPVIYVNPAFEAMTGYRRDQVIGRNCRFLQGRDVDQPELLELRQALAEGRDCRVVLRNYRAEGTLFWNELHLSPVRDREGRLSHFVGIQDNVTERRIHQLDLEHRASHDELTNLPNRNALREHIDHHLAAGEAERVGVVLLNLDRLHQVNDTLGHAAGDTVLVEIAGRLLEFAQAHQGRVARMGGDEFALVLALDPADEPEALLSARVAELFATIAEPIGMQGLDVHLTSSAGVSWSPQAGVDAAALLGHADLAMNRAKALGRNRVVLFSQELAAAAADRIELGAELREAMLVDDQLELHYQPLVDAATGAIAGAEALLRWNNPRRGMVSPGRFIPVAEDVGAIIDLGQWALERACAAAGGWSGSDDFGIAVNVSSVQFQRAEFVGEVVEVLKRTGLAPRRLKLEITESVVMQDTEGTLAALRQLRSIGVRISLDDFGTGYSSLAYLRQLPIDEIKIDRLFISDVTSDPYAATLCRAIIAMSQQLRLRVVAEGVETEAQARFLEQAGCGYLQGFLFSRPLPGKAFRTLLDAGTRWNVDGSLRLSTEHGAADN